MYAVVNHLHFTDPVDPSLFDGVTTDVIPRMSDFPGFESLHAVQTSDTEVVLVIVADSVATLDRLATEVGSPWMLEHVVPLLAAPPNRELGPILVSSQYT